MDQNNHGEGNYEGENWGLTRDSIRVIIRFVKRYGFTVNQFLVTIIIFLTGDPKGDKAGREESRPGR